MREADRVETLIPDPESVRVELARSARETRQLRALLKLSERTTRDQKFIEELRRNSPRSQLVGVA